MDKRTYESPMDWEYQTTGPMDPSSPFAQSSKQAQDRNKFGSSSNFGTFGQSPFTRTNSSPSKPAPHSPSIFSGSHLQRTTTAPPFRNPAFTTPRKPFDMDALSEISAAESSPAGSNGSDFADTPEHDELYDLRHRTITPATMSRKNSIVGKKASGKGDIMKPTFASRDKVRKRKRYNTDRDISRYRMPYIHPEEYDETDYESDDSTFQPGRAPKSQKKRGNGGWFGSFLTLIQKHPYVPSILGYWMSLAFNGVIMSGVFWIAWEIIAGLRKDFAQARSAVREDIVYEITKCRTDFIANRCVPLEQRLPAMHELCEQWDACMNQNPEAVKNVQLGAKGIVEIVNEIVDTMSYKTIALGVLLIVIFAFSGRSIYKSTTNYPDWPRQPPPYAQHHGGDQHLLGPSPQVYWQALQPQTPRHLNARHLVSNEETPDTDGSPPSRFKALTVPQTPGTRRSPSKEERGRSLTKSRSPSKRY
ncbi:Uu.00g108120.m01.CDS01 [Anthostomella pinea]|uniref:Uu.00g108120.m01.CDS01 n=1 Tax=Anthostomella pinea TaxID=933095 RepID=A0AAI8YFY8_9PEZI|nr:Uu.00g108120.m01.CDS01 [Anthostomella pinea]